ncbi:polysaccharide pyruvyl transferase family protein [Siccirubricoccus sp. G192]|uniref:polysaccharide pyruvyl transferase family protein n=1 Tax=Siccirubricoccus sp. G192 TaxID=2849651 RepID=UPI001C2BEBC8|nr:polysaccharide pyruvyl transferase family protein [Siccirubricoccus sp. G192]MBV1798187.1 polysaccharide pyruvyl transferase family protein [Siccirubricoccus sp. G192]
MRGAARFLDRAIKSGKPVVILPHTIRGHVETIASLENGLIFCRDQESQHFVSSVCGRPALLAHDMAFSIDTTRYGLWTALDMPAAVRAASESRTLYAFRRDSEAQARQHWALPSNNVDLSVTARTVGDDRASFLVQAAAFLTQVAQFDRIFTDRLHVAIAGALLGRSVVMFDNDYGKNAAIYRLSLQERFDCVEFFPSVSAYEETRGPLHRAAEFAL